MRGCTLSDFFRAKFKNVLGGGLASTEFLRGILPIPPPHLGIAEPNHVISLVAAGAPPFILWIIAVATRFGTTQVTSATKALNNAA